MSEIAGAYIDCGLCPYSGGCALCDHPLLQGLVLAEKIAIQWSQRGQSKADKVHAAQEIAERIRQRAAEIRKRLERT